MNAPDASQSGHDPGRTPTGLTESLSGPAMEPGQTEGLTATSGPAPPRRLGRYELFEEIAHGGMGVVLRAHDPELKRDLAVKVLGPGLAGHPEVVRRFVEEAQITAQLPHPGVVPIHDIGRDEQGLPFLVMKLVRGQTLEELLARRGSPEEELPRWVSVFEQICQAVAFAHSRRVIHRDLKPSNVMVGRFGEVQVMDWGLAKVLPAAGQRATAVTSSPLVSEVQTQRRDEPASYTQGMLGTPSYMAPEQAGGEWERVDERADVFGLGGILCAILTGKPPYEGHSREEVKRKALRGDVAGTFARLEACGAEGELVALAKACLSPEVGDRPHDAGKVAAAVTAYQHSVAERLRQAELERAAQQARAEEEAKRRRLSDELAAAAQARARAEAQRRRVTLGLAAAVLALVVVSAAAAAWWWQQRTAVGRDVEAALAEAAEHQAADRWPEAHAALERAEGRLGGAGPGALRDRVRQARADVDMVSQLDAIRLRQTGAYTGYGKFTLAGAEEPYAEAFRKYGIDAGRLPVAEAAAAVRASGTREPLLAGLDNWLRVRPPGQRAALQAVGDAADDNPWRLSCRAALVAGDHKKLKDLAVQPEALAQPAGMLVWLSDALNDAGLVDEAVALLRRAQRRHPEDFWINFDLGSRLLWDVRPKRPEEAVVCFRIAVALRPGSAVSHSCLGVAFYDLKDTDAGIAEYRRAIELDARLVAAHSNLGNALQAKGDVDGAIRCCRQAIDLDPKDAMAHNNLGVALKAKGDVDGAIRCYRKAIDVDPKLAMAHSNLGDALQDKGDVDGAIRCCRQAIDLDPKFAMAHNNLGVALKDKGDVDGAIRCFRQAIDLDPKYAMAHTNLGVALAAKGDVDGAIRCYRKAIDLDAKFAEAHCNVGLLLLRQGRFAEALTLLRRGHALGSRRPDWRYPSAQLVQRAEKLAALEPKIAALMEGKARPANAAEALTVAQYCQQARQMHAAAARLYAEAFAAQPKLADDLQASHRYDAACSAALAGCGQGKDADKLDEKERAKWRRQAFEWLRADLAALRKRVEQGKPQERAEVVQTLRHWQQDSDLARIRDAKALSALPAAERDAWRKLWADVDGLTQAVQGQK
jgi:serine/threonine-protein kinase